MNQIFVLKRMVDQGKLDGQNYLVFFLIFPLHPHKLPDLFSTSLITVLVDYRSCFGYFDITIKKIQKKKSKNMFERQNRKSVLYRLIGNFFHGRKMPRM